MNASHHDSYTPTAAEQHRRQQVHASKPPENLQGLLEPVARKRARPVLRGPLRSNARGLPDERWFRELTDKALRRGVFHSVPDLIAKIEDYLAAHNDHPKPFVWTATADDILAKVARGRVALQAVNQ